jgi:hypothetical protein
MTPNDLKAKTQNCSDDMGAKACRFRQIRDGSCALCGKRYEDEKRRAPATVAAPRGDSAGAGAIPPTLTALMGQTIC